jgi:steroid delta-isomerase-like uncharacterized protein
VSEKRMKLVEENLKAFTARDWNTYQRNLLPRFVYDEQATGLRAEGMDEAMKAIKSWTLAFPDLKGTIENIFHQDDMVMAEIRWEGTHNGTLKGPYGEFPPTGKKGVVKSVELFHFEGDKIREVRHYFDMMTLLHQIGVEVPTSV